MIELHTLTAHDAPDVLGLIRGYTARAIYAVTQRTTVTAVTFDLHWQDRDEPYVKRFDPPDAETQAYYKGLLDLGLSLGARADDQWVGMAVVEAVQWNRTLWVHEFHVAPGYHGQGIGRRMMVELIKRGRAAGLRMVTCETQNTNTPAIQFYRQLGFTIEGIDLSLYQGVADVDEQTFNEVALFMKHRLA